MTQWGQDMVAGGGQLEHVPIKGLEVVVAPCTANLSIMNWAHSCGQEGQQVNQSVWKIHAKIPFRTQKYISCVFLYFITFSLKFKTCNRHSETQNSELPLCKPGGCCKPAHLQSQVSLTLMEGCWQWPLKTIEIIWMRNSKLPQHTAVKSFVQ